MIEVLTNPDGLFYLDYDAETTFSTELEAVESHGKYFPNDIPFPDEESLSRSFDNVVEKMGITTEDKPMLMENFNNWTDSLCKDGILHPAQYNEYLYVGLYK